jgi:hypothetical protein
MELGNGYLVTKLIFLGLKIPLFERVWMELLGFVGWFMGFVFDALGAIFRGLDEVVGSEGIKVGVVSFVFWTC